MPRKPSKSEPTAHEGLLEAAKTAASTLHSDTSVDQETTAVSLRDLAAHVAMLIESLDEADDE